MSDRRPSRDSVLHTIKRIQECGYRVGVFLCRGAGVKDTIQIFLPGSKKFKEAEVKDYYDLVGVYGPAITADELHGDIRSVYSETA